MDPNFFESWNHPCLCLGTNTDVNNLIKLPFRRIRITGVLTETDNQSDSEVEVVDGRAPILMVSVENLVTQPFKSDTESKALTAEIIKTIRDIMGLNQLYKESLSHLLDSGKKDINAPAALADLAGALSNYDSAMVQQVRSARATHCVNSIYLRLYPSNCK